MVNAWAERLQQKHRTSKFPDQPPVLPERFRGLPQIDSAKCSSSCSACVAVCQTQAVSQKLGVTLDLGRCTFCGDCAASCAPGALRFSQDYRLSARERVDLEIGSKGFKLAEALDKQSRALFGRSLKLRQVSAGGCAACEADVNVLGTIVYDLGRFGIQFVASPRHADGLLITGPVTRNMRLALEKTYAAVPSPKLVIAVGACAISGGLFRDNPEVLNGAEAVLPVDLYIPGCPPHPYTTLDGLLRLLGRIDDKGAR